MNISAVYGVTEATFTVSQTVVAICIFDIAIVVVIVFVVCVHMRMYGMQWICLVSFSCFGALLTLRNVSFAVQ